jgi:hypothetical protein
MTTEQATTRIIDGTVVSILFKDDRNGKEFVTVAIQQDGLTYPTNVRSRDVEILQRMVNANKHIQAGKQITLGVDVRETPRAEGGYFRDILSITRFALDDVAQEPPTPPQSAPRSTQPAYNAAPSTELWSNSVDERIAWNSAVNNAVSAVAYAGAYQEEFAQNDWVVEVDSIANLIYPLIRRGPSPNAPERPQAAPEPTSVDKVEESPDESDEGVFEV